jgi:uncharacterized protein
MLDRWARAARGRLRSRSARVTEDSAPAGTSIAGADTSTAAFVGSARTAAAGEPVEVASASEYERAFGTLDDELERGVRLFFANGGARAWVVPVAGGLLDGLSRLDGLRFSLLALPEAGELDPESAARVAVAAAEICERRRAFLLVDPPSSADVVEWARELGSLRNAAAYVPRLRLADGSESAASGAVAGILARTDRERGVWKAPAGSSATVRDVADATVTLSEAAVERLVAAGVNVVRGLPSGLVLWGARTLAVDDPEWKYVNVRRLALFLESSIEEGTQWAVFEPNGEQLWNEVRRRVEEFMLTLFQQGAFQGTRPEDAYFVRCDRTTMTQNDIDNGRLVVVVGFAPAQPAEFVVLRIE